MRSSELTTVESGKASENVFSEGQGRVQPEYLQELGALPQTCGAGHEAARADDGLRAVEVVRYLVPVNQGPASYFISYTACAL